MSRCYPVSDSDDYRYAQYDDEEQRQGGKFHPNMDGNNGETIPKQKKKRIRKRIRKEKKRIRKEKNSKKNSKNSARRTYRQKNDD